MVTVSADIDSSAITGAAIGLGFRNGTVSRSGLVRAALALFHGGTEREAIELAATVKNSRLGSNREKMQDWVTANVPDGLADTGEINRALAIRIGLAMAAGYSREDAETHARNCVRSVGRPCKNNKTP
jgi:hypothetical protein